MQQLKRATLTPETQFKTLFIPANSPFAKASHIAKTKVKGREMHSPVEVGEKELYLANNCLI